MKYKMLVKFINMKLNYRDKPMEEMDLEPMEDYSKVIHTTHRFYCYRNSDSIFTIYLFIFFVHTWCRL